MSADGGYTRQYRRIWCHPAFRSKQEAAVFSWLKDAARWRDGCLQTRYGPVQLRRGEVLIAEREVAEDFGLARNTLRALFDRMASMGMIALIRGDGRAPQRAGTILAVCNYDAYQLGAELTSLGTANSAEAGPQQDRTGDHSGTATGPQESQENSGFGGDLEIDQDRNRTAERTANGPHEDRSRTKNKEEKEVKEGKEDISLPPAVAAGECVLPEVGQSASAVVLTMPTAVVPARSSLFVDEPAPRAKPTKRAAEPEGFAGWYDLYPRHEARADAAKAFPEAVRAAGGLDRLMALTQSHRFRDEVRFIPYPASWLRGKRWTDQPVQDTADGRVVRFPSDPHQAAASGAGIGPEPSRNSPEWLRWNQMRVRAEARARQGKPQADGDGPIIDGYAERMA